MTVSAATAAGTPSANEPRKARGGRRANSQAAPPSPGAELETHQELLHQFGVQDAAHPLGSRGPGAILEKFGPSDNARRTRAHEAKHEREEALAVAAEEATGGSRAGRSFGHRRRLNVGRGAGWPNAAWVPTRWVWSQTDSSRTANKRAVSGPSWNVASRDAQVLVRQCRHCSLACLRLLGANGCCCALRGVPSIRLNHSIVF